MTQDDVIFGQRIPHTVRVTSANLDFQLMRASWAAPYQLRARIKKLVVSNRNGVAGAIFIWDDDLSSTTPPIRGSAAAPLITIGVAASPASGVSASNTVLDEDDLPNEEFDSGIALQGTQINMAVMAEVEYF